MGFYTNSEKIAGLAVLGLATKFGIQAEIHTTTGDKRYHIEFENQNTRTSERISYFPSGLVFALEAK